MNKKSIFLIGGIATLVLIGVLVYFLFFYSPAVSKDLAGDANNASLPASGSSLITGEGENNSMPNSQGSVPSATGYRAILNDLQKLSPGVDYMENEVVCTCNTKKEAQAVADSIGGELSSFSDGVGIITIPTTVYDLFLLLAEGGGSEVVVSPNYIYSTASGSLSTNVV